MLIIISLSELTTLINEPFIPQPTARSSIWLPPIGMSVRSTNMLCQCKTSQRVYHLTHTKPPSLPPTLGSGKSFSLHYRCYTHLPCSRYCSICLEDLSTSTKNVLGYSFLLRKGILEIPITDFEEVLRVVNRVHRLCNSPTTEPRRVLLNRQQALYNYITHGYTTRHRHSIPRVHPL